MSTSNNSSTDGLESGRVETAAPVITLGIAALGEAFFAVERAENLYSWRVMGVQIWPVMRSRLLKTLMANSGIFSSGQGKQVDFYDDVEQYRGRKPSLLLWRAVRFGWLGPLASFWLRPRKIDGAAPYLAEPDYRNLRSKRAIIVPFATRDGREPHIEKFSQPVIDALGDDALVLGVGTWDKITNRPRVEDLNGFFNRRWHWPVAIIVRLCVKKADLAKYARVVEALETYTGVNLDPMRTFPRWMLRIFFIQKHGYRKIFKKTSARHVFAVNAARMPLQAAAQSLGMKVIEIQSGVFSKYSLQFSWPGSPHIEYIPDEIWTWGDYWTAGIERAGGQSVRVIGSTAEFESVRDRSRGQVAVGQVVWLSQPTIGLDILAAALDFAAAKPDLKVILKLHPRNEIEEFKNFIEQQPQLAPTNFSLMQFEKTSLEIIAESEISVGVFSTALIEAAGLGAKVAIIKLPGWEHLAPLIDGGYASAFDTVTGLVAGLDQLKNPADEYFFYGRRSDIPDILDELITN